MLPSVINSLQTNVSHVKDNSIAPFNPPGLSMQIDIVDQPGALNGARYGIVVKHGTLFSHVVPVYGISQPYEIDVNVAGVNKAIARGRNECRKVMEAYAHELYAPVVSTMAEAHTVIVALCDLFFGDGTDGSPQLSIDRVVNDLSTTEEKLKKVLEGLKAYRDQSNFDKELADE